MRLFRIHIRPKGGSQNMQETFRHCLKNGVLGVGWRVKGLRKGSKWERYFAKASKLYGKVRNCEYIHNNVGRNDLVWTRDPAGAYYLARVKSGWKYWPAPETNGYDIDIGNVFSCSLHRINLDEVPGKVVACFRSPRSIQEITNVGALEYSKYLWNKKEKRQVFKIDRSLYSGDIFMMLDDEETEDLVFLYLQSLGWHIVPNSRKADTMSFECYLVRPETGEIALVQVKTGDTCINQNKYSDDKNQVFLFQSNEYYAGKKTKHVTCLTRSQIEAFLRKSRHWLPNIFKTKASLVDFH